MFNNAPQKNAIEENIANDKGNIHGYLTNGVTQVEKNIFRPNISRLQIYSSRWSTIVMQLDIAFRNA